MREKDETRAPGTLEDVSEPVEGGPQEKKREEPIPEPAQNPQAPTMR